MNGSVKLGRIAGIEIEVNWSWLVVFALIVSTLATAVFPSWTPSVSATIHWAMAAVATIAVFASILLHELGHALVAKRQGIEIDGITLWLFGGVARLRRHGYPSARAEFVVAIAGPAVSTAIGLALVSLGVLLPVSSSVEAVALWVGYANLILVAFNLLPGLPLDGGRVLHASVWRAKDDLAFATRAAATAGHALALLMVAAGVVLFVIGAYVSGVWFALLGWFLAAAARAEGAGASGRNRRRDLRVEDVMVREPVAVRRDLRIGDFVDEVVSRTPHTTYPVITDGTVAGLLFFRCIAEIPRHEWDRTKVDECMLRPESIAAVEPDAKVAEVLPELARRRRALVVDGDQLVGLLTLPDAVRALTSEGPRPEGDEGSHRRRGEVPPPE